MQVPERAISETPYNILHRITLKPLVPSFQRVSLLFSHRETDRPSTVTLTAHVPRVNNTGRLMRMSSILGTIDLKSGVLEIAVTLY